VTVSPGLGKTHLAIALGLLTAEAGHRVYFTTAIEMIRRLCKALEENKLHRELHNMTRPKLLVIDEVGYLQLGGPNAGQSLLSGDLPTLR
jgi:DNA replication protein DnaC